MSLGRIVISNVEGIRSPIDDLPLEHRVAGIRLGVELTESKPWVMNVHVNTVIKIIAANNSDYAPAHAAIAA
jgi:hypothetical protein